MSGLSCEPIRKPFTVLPLRFLHSGHSGHSRFRISFRFIKHRLRRRIARRKVERFRGLNGRRKVVFAIGAVGLIALAASWLVAGRLVAPANCKIGDPPDDLNVTSITLASDSGSTIAGWHVKSEDARGVVVLLHGIRGNRRAMLRRARLLAGHGYSSVLIDLQAHGESPGQRITLGHRERHDVRAAVAYAKRSYPAHPVGVIGVSLGGASAILASPLDIDAMVVESVYSDIETAIDNRVGGILGPLAMIPSAILKLQLKPRLGVSPNQLRPIDRIARVDCPILIISGQDDTHTTARETRQMFDQAASPKHLWLVPAAGHEDLMQFAPIGYQKRILAFFDEHLNIDHHSAIPEAGLEPARP